MKTIGIDIETYSDVDLKLGVYKYVDSSNFKILLFGYSIDNGPAEVIDLEHGEKIPEKIKAALENNLVLKTAYNAQFERVCLNKFLNLNTVNWECTMIKAWTLGIGGGLASVGDALGLSEDENKIKEGRKLINKFCKPRKATQLSINNYEWKRFKEYCKRDVEVEQKIREKLSVFETVDFEKNLYKIDQEINDNGIKLDLDMIAQAIKIDDALIARETEKFQKITGLENPNSIVDIKGFIKKRTGIEVKSLAKGKLKDLAKEFQSAKDVVKVLEIRELLSKTSTAKYRMMEEVVMEDGRSRGNIQFYGALRTGRWSGRLIQVHNLPRNHVSDLEIARETVCIGDLDLLETLYDNPSDILSQCLRAAIIPEDGKKFLVADFSAIEARVIAWLANENWVLDVFRSHGKIYEAAASRMFNIPIEKINKGSDLRQRGKVATLALGYQGGVGALKAMGALEMGIPEDDLQPIVDRWRETNSNIVSLWKDTEDVVKKVIEHGGVSNWSSNRLKAYKYKGFLFIELPSGRKLAYPKPKVVPSKRFMYLDQIQYLERKGSTWVTRETYGGSLVENIVQGIARDCLAYSITRLYNEGYKIVMHVHDEVIIEIDKDKDELENVLNIMGEDIPWAKGLPLVADGYECNFYMKD